MNDPVYYTLAVAIILLILIAVLGFKVENLENELRHNRQLTHILYGKIEKLEEKVNED